MSFFKFIVDKKKLLPDAIARALVYQQKQSPSLLECLVDHPKLDHQQLLQLVIYAQEHFVDLKTAQEKQKFIEETLFNQCLKKYIDRLTPIGLACTELGLISALEYENILGEYQLIKENESLPLPKAMAVSDNEPEMSEAALESLRELGIADISMLSGEKKN